MSHSLDICDCLIMHSNVKCIDLSYSLNKNTIYWPTDELGFQLCMNCSGDQLTNSFYAAGTFSCAEHGGTHVDAPYHFNQDGKTVDMLTLDQLIAPLRVIDISSKIFTEHSIHRDYTLTKEDIEVYESQYGLIQSGEIVFIKTLWSQLYEKGSKEYLGFDCNIDGKYNHITTTLRFPGCSPDASRLFVERHVSGVGLDTASLDPGYSKDFASHRILLENGIYGIENINGNIALLPPIGATAVIMPLKISGGSGAPSRIFAMIPK